MTCCMYVAVQELSLVQELLDQDQKHIFADWPPPGVWPLREITCVQHLGSVQLLMETCLQGTVTKRRGHCYSNSSI